MFINKKRGFTLVELMSVVSIIAILAAVLIPGIGAIRDRVRHVQQVTLHEQLKDAVNQFSVANGRLPENLEGGFAMDLGTHSSNFVFEKSTSDNVLWMDPFDPFNPDYLPPWKVNPFLYLCPLGAFQAPQSSGSFLAPTPPYAAPFYPIEMEKWHLQNLAEAGVGRIRFLDYKGLNTVGQHLDLKVDDLNNSAYNVGPFAEIKNINSAYNKPHIDAGKNLGRGFALQLSKNNIYNNTGAGVPALRWYPGYKGFNNKLIGGKEDSFIIGLGVGDESCLVKKGFLERAPELRYMSRGEYQHYLMLIDVSERPAKFLSLVTPEGKLLAELEAGEVLRNNGTPPSALP